MKRILSVFLFICSVQFITAQVYKFNAYQLAFYDIKKEKWEPFEDTDILVSMNVDGKKIKIYSKEAQSFDIITVEEKKKDTDGDDTFSFYCEDQNGITCYVDFMILNSKNGIRQLYITYSNAKYVYNIEYLE